MREHRAELLSSLRVRRRTDVAPFFSTFEPGTATGRVDEQGSAQRRPARCGARDRAETALGRAAWSGMDAPPSDAAQTARAEGRAGQTDRQTVLIGTRTHTHPDSISSRLRLCISHVTTTYWDYIGSSRFTGMEKYSTPHPLSPGDPWPHVRLCSKTTGYPTEVCGVDRIIPWPPHLQADLSVTSFVHK